MTSCYIVAHPISHGNHFISTSSSYRKTPTRFLVGFKLRCSANLTAPVPKFKSGDHRPLQPALRALESMRIDEFDTQTLGSLVVDLSPKEQTLLLKSQKDWKRAILLFRCIKCQEGYDPNPIHYNVILRTLGRARQWDELRRCWIEMADDRVFPTNNTYATLIDIYSKAGLVREALLWLKHMKSRGIAPDEVTMNTALGILKDSRQFDRAERFFRSWCSGSSDLDCLGIDSDEMNLSPVGPKQFLLTELFKFGGRLPVSRIGSSCSEVTHRIPRLAATYNTLIDLYGKAGQLRDASEAFSDMLRRGVAPDTTTFNTMMNICGLHGNMFEAEELLVKMEERRVLRDTKTFNILMSLYDSEGDISMVLMYYKKIKLAALTPDCVSQRIIFQALCGRRMIPEVENVIEEMMESEVRIDEQSLPVVIKMYVDDDMLDEAKQFFEKHCSDRGVSSKNFAAIIDAYAEKGYWEEAENLFLLKRNSKCKSGVEEFNVMVKAYGKAKRYNKALSLFESMSSCGTWPDECTYNSLIQMLSGGNITDKARELLRKMKSAGFKARCTTFSALIACYCRANSVSDALDVYQEMKAVGVKPNEVIFGALIDAFAESGDAEEARKYFQLMENCGVEANRIIITSLIKAYAKIGSWKEAQEMYARMKNSDESPDTIASNCMINLYAGLGMVKEARAIFYEMKENGQADGNSYSTMMYLYKNMAMFDEAIVVAQDMQDSGLLTDCNSYNNIIASYAANGKLKYCGELVHQMLEEKILPDEATFRMIFSLLKKRRLSSEAVSQLQSSFDEAKPYARQTVLTALFSALGLHSLALEYCEAFLASEISIDISAYNVAIGTYGSASEVEKALRLFMKMQDVGLIPDVVTYISLVGCYGKGGMVEGIRRIYNSIKYGEIEPSKSLFRALIRAYHDAGKHDLADLVYQEMKFSIQAEQDYEYSDDET